MKIQVKNFKMTYIWMIPLVLFCSERCFEFILLMKTKKETSKIDF